MAEYRVRFTCRETSFVEHYMIVEAGSAKAAYARVADIQSGDADATADEEESEYTGKEYCDGSEFEGMDNPLDHGVVSLIDPEGVYVSCHGEFSDWARPTTQPAPVPMEAETVTISAADLRALMQAASAYADDLASGLDDGTYDDEAGLSGVTAALERAAAIVCVESGEA